PGSTILLRSRPLAFHRLPCTACDHSVLGAIQSIAGNGTVRNLNLLACPISGTGHRCTRLPFYIRDARPGVYHPTQANPSRRPAARGQCLSRTNNLEPILPIDPCCRIGKPSVVSIQFRLQLFEGLNWYRHLSRPAHIPDFSKCVMAPSRPGTRSSVVGFPAVGCSNSYTKAVHV